MDIYCFGDSITRGESDGERGGWVDRLKTECIARRLAGGEPEDCVFNLGVGGETTRGLRARLAPELSARAAAGARFRVALAYGANDAAESGGAFLVPLEEYVETLSWAVDEARRLGGEVWLVNVTPVAPSADGARNRSGRLRSNAAVARYNAGLAALAARKSAPLVDVDGALRGRDLAPLFAPDGVHPSARGHELIFALARERLIGAR